MQLKVIKRLFISLERAMCVLVAYVRAWLVWLIDQPFLYCHNDKRSNKCPRLETAPSSPLSKLLHVLPNMTATGTKSCANGVGGVNTDHFYDEEASAKVS